MSKQNENGNYFGASCLLTLATGLFVGLEIDLHSTWKIVASVVTGVPMIYCWYKFFKTK